MFPNKVFFIVSFNTKAKESLNPQNNIDLLSSMGKYAAIYIKNEQNYITKTLYYCEKL